MNEKESHHQNVESFYLPWLERYGIPAGCSSGAQNKHTESQSSADAVLTSFAQMSCWRLQMERTIISLVSPPQHYRLACATQETSFAVERTDEQCQNSSFDTDLLWTKDTTALALSPGEYRCRYADGRDYCISALVVNDTASNEEFRSWTFQGVAFLISVPMVTKDGHTIGLYTMSDSRPRDGLAADDLGFINSMASSVMEHLDVVRLCHTRQSADVPSKVPGQTNEGLTPDISDSADQSAPSPPNTGDAGQAHHWELDVAGAFEHMQISGESLNSSVQGDQDILETTSQQDSDAFRDSFLQNISHELRTPLHGILGSIEFLQDTAVDDFQSGLITAVETCGRTLLDTIDHVLDHAKMKQWSSKYLIQGAPNEAGDKNTYSSHATDNVFDLAVVVEEVVEACFAGQTFRGTSPEVSALQEHGSPMNAENVACRTRSRLRRQVAEGSAKFAQEMHLTLDIDYHEDWFVKTTPGAIRRALGNVVGNAFKFTSTGSVSVHLRLEKATDTSLEVCLEVTDTGRGISTDFQNDCAFRPFQQEDTFTSGVGLGLSIVKRIVTSLGGTVDLWSEKGTGTKISIRLTLPKAKKQSSGDESTEETLESAQKDFEGKTACLLAPQGFTRRSDNMPQGAHLPTVADSFRSLAANWFGMHVIESQNMDGVVADMFVYAEPPPIEHLLYEHGNTAKATEIPVILMCTNAFESAALRANGIHHLADIGRIMEIIAQPLGPQKLAKVLHRTRRRKDLELDLQIHTPRHQPISRSVSQNPGTFDATESLAMDPPSRNSDKDPEGPENGQKSQAPINEDKPDLRTDRLRDFLNDFRPSHIRAKSMPPITAAVIGQRRQESIEDRLRDQSKGCQSRGRAEHILASFCPLPSPAVPKSEASASSSPTPRVLLVDDNPINLQLLTTFMKKADFPYKTAENGLQALEAFKTACEDSEQSNFRYVLMDISMPVMDGFESAKRIREFEHDQPENNHSDSSKKGVRAKPAVIIALTGLSGADVQEDALKSGMDHFLSKPVKFNALKAFLV